MIDILLVWGLYCLFICNCNNYQTGVYVHSDIYLHLANIYIHFESTVFLNCIVCIQFNSSTHTTTSLLFLCYRSMHFAYTFQSISITRNTQSDPKWAPKIFRKQEIVKNVRLPHRPLHPHHRHSMWRPKNMKLPQQNHHPPNNNNNKNHPNPKFQLTVTTLPAVVHSKSNNNLIKLLQLLIN